MGTVIKARMIDELAVAIKYMQNKDIFENEKNNQQLAAVQGISPKIVNDGVDAKTGVYVIVMELMPKCLEDLRLEF